MLDQSAVGLSTTQKFAYTWRDIILYNLSVGFRIWYSYAYSFGSGGYCKVNYSEKIKPADA